MTHIVHLDLVTPNPEHATCTLHYRNANMTKHDSMFDPTILNEHPEGTSAIMHPLPDLNFVQAV